MKKRNSVYMLGILFTMSSCELISTSDLSLTTDEIVEGLKTALTVGTDSSSSVLSLANGYYGDALVKIPLPDEAIKVQNEIIAVISLAPSLDAFLNLDQQFENVVMALNRAAEDAAKESAPIFKDAITDLTISQGLDILNGQVPASNGSKSADFDSTAATQYLKGETFLPLTNLYAPKIDVALDKDLGLGFSANDAWATLRTSYNSAVNTIKGNLFTNTALELTGYALDPLEIESIGVFATEKALDGLFYKVGQEEIKIRRDPWQWVSTTVGDILTKVFGAE